MLLQCRLLGFALAMFSAFSAAYAQNETEPDPLREKAMVLFAYEIGLWRTTWKTLDGNGEVIKVETGSEKISWTLDRTAVEMETRVYGRDPWNKAIKFYNPEAGEIVFVDVSTAGDFWIMRQDIQTEVHRSLPKVLSDGREVLIKFTILSKSQNEQHVIMERSVDGGNNWALRKRQHMVRVVD